VTVSRNLPAQVRRLRGVYFTPPEVAGYLARSADRLVREAFSRSLADCTLIEPALGDGAFARAILAMAPGARIVGYEVVPEIAAAARRILPPAVEIRVGSALDAAPRAGGIPVILGNPPWRGHTANPGTVAELLRDWHPAGERNTKWLQDDYVRFMRWATEVVATAGQGLVGFVTNHSWLRGPTHRRMREHLVEVFDDVRVLDLHGSCLRPEPGCRDENVFPVRTGVAVVLLVRVSGGSMRPAGGDFGLARRFDLVGTRGEKFAWLASHDVASTPWRVVVATPADAAYAAWPSLPDLFRVWSTGMVSGQDAHAYFPTRSALLAAHPELPSSEAFQALYRPGDLRWTSFALHTRPRRKVMRHLLEPGNRALVALRQSGPGVRVRHLVADRPIDNCVLSTESTARAYAFPLKLADGSWNLDPAPLGLEDPEETFRHIVKTLADPAYQETHREQLLRDFPRIPPSR
jgi:predicted helicase